MLTIHNVLLEECPNEECKSIIDFGHSDQQRRWKVFARVVGEENRGMKNCMPSWLYRTNTQDWFHQVREAILGAKGRICFVNTEVPGLTSLTIMHQQYFWVQFTLELVVAWCPVPQSTHHSSVCSRKYHGAVWGQITFHKSCGIAEIGVWMGTCMKGCRPWQC